MDTCSSFISKAPITYFGVAQFTFAIAFWSTIFGFANSYYEESHFKCDSIVALVNDRCYKKYTHEINPRIYPTTFLYLNGFLLWSIWAIFAIPLGFYIKRYSKSAKELESKRETSPGATTPLLSEQNYEDQAGKNSKFLHKAYCFHIIIRLLFLAVCLIFFCKSQKLDLPSEFRCNSRNNSHLRHLMVDFVEESFTECIDHRSSQKSQISYAVIVFNRLGIIFAILEMIYLCLAFGCCKYPSNALFLYFLRSK